MVILGGGFGGLAAARALAHAPVRVTLVDEKNHHLFQPLLYQVATAALSAPDIAAPLRRLLARQKNATVLMSPVLRIDVRDRRVVLDHDELEYDYLPRRDRDDQQLLRSRRLGRPTPPGSRRCTRRSTSGRACSARTRPPSARRRRTGGASCSPSW
ncbi:MAG: FAD-dependent oxidoreductase [Sandaracinaceae bacterium]|nr:FAD-dependent oxidoreductase [Sandaracinaceae bacterium]